LAHAAIHLADDVAVVGSSGGSPRRAGTTDSLIRRRASPASAARNFPQALTHSSLVRAYIALRDAQRRQGTSSTPSAMP
jgi:hypothetical protein